jgi:hypothetical protein
MWRQVDSRIAHPALIDSNLADFIFSGRPRNKAIAPLVLIAAKEEIGGELRWDGARLS